MQKLRMQAEKDILTIGKTQNSKQPDNYSTQNSQQQSDHYKINKTSDLVVQKTQQRIANTKVNSPRNSPNNSPNNSPINSPNKIKRTKILLSSQNSQPQSEYEEIIVKQQDIKTTKFMMSPIYLVTALLTIFFFGFAIGSIFNTKIYNGQKIINAKRVYKMSYDKNVKLAKIIEQKDSIISLLTTNLQLQNSLLISYNLSKIQHSSGNCMNFNNSEFKKNLQSFSNLIQSHKIKSEVKANQAPNQPIMDHFLNATIRISGQIQPGERFQKSLVQFGIILFIFIIFGSASPIQCCELFFALIACGTLGFLMMQTVEPLI